MARTPTQKGCTKCGRTLAVGEFYKDKSQKGGRSPWCKSCERSYNKAYRAGLKKADAPRKADIAEAKGVKAFETTMKPERVKRTKRDGTRTAAAKTRTKARASARKAKGAK